ncbi:pentapeptide repeat-containing protein [Streptomyces sp. NPDC005046]
MPASTVTWRAYRGGTTCREDQLMSAQPDHAPVSLGGAGFDKVQSSDTAGFDQAQFAGNARFGGAQFHGDAGFNAGRY